MNIMKKPVLLITSCLQNDFFIGTMANPFYIGKSESMRLLGSGLNSGPLSSFMKWVRIQDENKLMTIHMKQQFEKPTPISNDDVKRHYETMKTVFGSEVCIKDTQGEKLILNLEDNMKSNEIISIIHGMNAFVNGSKLSKSIEEWYPELDERKECKVALIGLWSDSLLYFLTYELRTRYGFKNLATSSILTASPSRMQHFNSMQQMNRLFDIHVFESIKKFQDWLVEDGNQLNALNLEGDLVCGLQIIGPSGSNTQLDPQIRQIFCYMYRTSSKIYLEPLDGGFSNASVYKCKSWDQFGHEQVTTVLKINSIRKISAEKNNFEKVESILGNRAPQILDYLELPNGNTASIKFSYASLSGDDSKTFYSIYLDPTVTQETINYILNETFVTTLGKFYRVSSYERDINIFELYNFDGKGWSWNEGGSDTPSKVRDRIKEILGCDSNLDSIIFPNGQSLKNVANFLEYKLENIKKNVKRIKDHVFMSYVHGDANGRNILVDHNNNVFLIDFEYTKYDHMLKDVTKIENDVLFEYTKVENELEFVEAMKITNELLSVEDLGLSLKKEIGLTIPKFIRAWETIRTLRNIVSQLVKDDRSTFQMDVVLLRYALHSMTLNYPKYNRAWALAAACGFAKRIEDRANRNISLYIKWINQQPSDNVKVGITLLPGRIDKGGNLKGDITTLIEEKVSTLFVLCTFQELEERLPPKADLENTCKELGLEVKFFPIAYNSTPTNESALHMIKKISEEMDKANGNICLTSVSGLGRCGIIASSLLMYRDPNMTSEEAKRIVREARSHRSIESEAQSNFVDNFYIFLQKRKNLPI